MARVQKMDDKKNKTKIIIIFARKLDKQFLYNCYGFVPTVVPRSDFIDGDFPSEYWLMYAQFGFFVLAEVIAISTGIKLAGCCMLNLDSSFWRW
jgi:hypothetical protein